MRRIESHRGISAPRKQFHLANILVEPEQVFVVHSPAVEFQGLEMKALKAADCGPPLIHG